MIRALVAAPARAAAAVCAGLLAVPTPNPAGASPLHACIDNYLGWSRGRISVAETCYMAPPAVAHPDGPWTPSGDRAGIYVLDLPGEVYPARWVPPAGCGWIGRFLVCRGPVT